MEVVRISRRVILLEMVQELGLYLSGYETHEINGGKFISSVSIRGVVLVRGKHVSLQTCHGLPECSVQKAEEACASSAITNIKRTFEVELDDISYVEKLVLDLQNHDYEIQLKQNQDTIEHLANLVAELRDGWECTIKQMECTMHMWDPTATGSDGEEGSLVGRTNEGVYGPAAEDTPPRSNGLSPYEDITKTLGVIHTDVVKALEATKEKISIMGIQLP